MILRMILKKLKAPINNNNGMALIVSLCVATFIMALSLALIFSTAQISSNINNKLLREQAQQQASSFADVIGEELKDSSSDIYTAVSKLCDNIDTLEKDCDLDLVVPDAYKSKKYGSVKVTLCKLVSSEASDTDDSDWQDFYAVAPYYDDPIDYDVDVTVVVTMEKGIYATVTDTYTRSTHYDYTYKLDNAEATEYFEYPVGTEIYFRRLNSATNLQIPSGADLTMNMLMNNTELMGNLGDGTKLTRKRTGTGTSVFTFKGRE
jgi:hypothetical protein